MRTLECRFGRQSGQLTHQANEMHSRHFGDERIALGHVADQRADLFRVVEDVVAEDLRGARVWLMKPEQRVNQRRLARAVWTKQTDRAPTQVAAQVLKYLPAAESSTQTVKIGPRRVVDCVRLDQFSLNLHVEFHTGSYIAAS